MRRHTERPVQRTRCFERASTVTLESRVQQNAADTSRPKSLWLISHERDDPMVLAQAEYSANEAIEALRRAIGDRVGNTVQVDPPLATDQIGRRYDVHDRNGWLATFWLSEEQIANDEGMLTSIVSPGARQRAHHTFHRH
jgi:hypothetical protein